MVVGLSSQFSNWSWSLGFFWLTMTFDQTNCPDYKPKTYLKLYKFISFAVYI